jgi:hypothetical protein
MINPHYPQVILTFAYRGCKVEIECDDSDEENTYTAWVNYQQGCVVAVPLALSRAEAVKRAKRWIEQKFPIS